MAANKGHWLPCAVCRGCDEELAKEPPYNSPVKTANFYCSQPIWMPAKSVAKAKPAWMPGTKKQPRKLGKKAQFWADYHKQQDNIKRSQFFVPKKEKSKPPKSTEDIVGEFDAKPKAQDRQNTKDSA